MLRSARITAHHRALVLPIMISKRRARGKRGFCRFCTIALPACECISQPNPTETVVASWFRMHASRKWCNKITCPRARPIAFGTLSLWMLSLCSHRMITGDHRLYQTTKLWLRTTVNAL